MSDQRRVVIGVKHVGDLIRGLIIRFLGSVIIVEDEPIPVVQTGVRHHLHKGGGVKGVQAVFIPFCDHQGLTLNRGNGTHTGEGIAHHTGAPEVSISLNDKVQVLSKNDRITLALLPKEEGHYLLTAMGQTGTDQASYTPGPEVMPGFSFTMVRLDGKLYAETLEGTILVKSNKASLLTLDPIGQVLKEIPGVSAEGCVRFELSGEVPAINYELIME